MANAADKEQIEMLAKWWKDYGKAIVIAIVVGLIVGFGWRYWSNFKTKHTERAAALYQNLYRASVVGDKKTETKLVAVLKKDFFDTPYATMGVFITANTDITNKKLADALTELQWVVKHGKVKSFKQIARLRAARILLAEKQYPQALAILKTVDDKTFAPLINTVKGDIYSAQGDEAKANSAYKKAKSGYTTLNISNPYLDMRISS